MGAGNGAPGVAVDDLERDGAQMDARLGVLEDLEVVVVVVVAAL